MRKLLFCILMYFVAIAIPVVSPALASAGGESAGERSIAAGGPHALALKTDGSLWAWGRNDYGPLGAGGIPPIVPMTP